MTALATTRTERAALCDLMDELGPEAPTLCEGWRTKDLAAHLVLRERRPDAAGGLVFSPLAGHLAHVQARLASRPYPEMVQLVRTGPPSWSPQRIGPLDRASNTVEFLVHHEDVRRAQQDWAPREPDPVRDAEVWDRLRRMGRFMTRKSPVGVVLEAPGSEPAAVKSAEPSVVVRGEPTELALFLTGRGDHARVELIGPPEAVEQLRTTSFGM